LQRLLSAGRVDVEIGANGDRVLLVVTLLPGQSIKSLSPGQRVAVRGTLSRGPRPAAIGVGPGQWLLGSGVTYGPVRVIDPKVLHPSRRTLRRRMRAPLAVGLVLPATLGLVLWFGHWVTPLGTFFLGCLTLTGALWTTARASRMRGLIRLLDHGGHASPAKVLGRTRRFPYRDTVWLQVLGSTGPGHLEVSPLPGRAHRMLPAGCPVTVYGSDQGHGPVLVVGLLPGSSLLGWGAPVES
jgi:hypothetical protein